MASSPAGSDASHESDPESQTADNSKNTSAKDKECQYCHQKFTSSSLGRHLDQFISKKKPDGIHDVEGIKKLRAGITRRTARGGKRDNYEHQESQEKSAHASPTLSPSNGPTPAFLESLNRSQPGTNDVRFNRMGWQSTGVITDPVPPRVDGVSTASQSHAINSNMNSAAGQKRNFSTYAADLPTTTANESMRALELSLREVIDAVNVATRHSNPLPQPFPFDLTSQTFSSLCLLLLPTPATLFQPSPFSTNTTIPLKPPGIEQLQALRHKIRVALDQWKWDALAHMQRNTLQHGTSVGEEAQRLSETTQQHIEDAMHHLDHAYQYFITHSPEQQYQFWSIELLRAYKSEQDKLKEANEKITRITQEAAQLQQQVDHLSRCQWPREMALWPPERNTFSSAVQKELENSKFGGHTSLDSINAYGTSASLDLLQPSLEDRWDFDKLVNKWKRHVREDRARRGGGTGSMLPPLSENLNEPSRTGTPPIYMRNAMSDVANFQNGHAPSKSTSQTNSPTVNSGFNSNMNSSLGITDKPMTFATNNQNSSSNMNRPFAGTPNNSIPSRTQTPSVQIISDVHDHMARFAPWYKQKELEERMERERDAMAAGD